MKAKEDIDTNRTSSRVELDDLLDRLTELSHSMGSDNSRSTSGGAGTPAVPALSRRSVANIDFMEGSGKANPNFFGRNGEPSIDFADDDIFAPTNGVVQQQVKGYERSIMNTGDPQQRKMDEQKKQEKLAKKAMKKAKQQEQEALFGEALMAISKKTSTKTSKSTEAKGRDHEDDGKKAGTSRAMKMMYQMDAKEMEDKLREDPNYVPTMEDDIEQQRQDMFDTLKKAGNKGTPVTEETLNAWLEKKRKLRAAAARKLVEAELKKKKGGKGLAVLTGRDLYEYNKDLFRDDDEADNNGDAARDGFDDGNRPNGAERSGGGVYDKSKGHGGEDGDGNDDAVINVADRVNSELFLEGDDDDLDDLDEDD